MREIVFVTCNAMPELTESDALVAAALEAQGASVTRAPWNGQQSPFAQADLIVMRSTWDYTSHYQAFAEWLDTLGAYKSVVNSPSLMRWNMTKGYLLELVQKGAPMPPTLTVKPDAGSVAAAMDALGIDEAVVKPQIGATASGLSIARANDDASLAAAAARLGAATGDMDGLIQPLITEIRDIGETSMIFIEGEFSHAVVKRPNSGDIRVQEEHGGRTELVDPPIWAIAAGARILDLLPEPAFYARVDAVILDETLKLMEVELIEPELFFTYSPEADFGAADRFAAALIQRL